MNADYIMLLFKNKKGNGFDVKNNNQIFMKTGRDICRCNINFFNFSGKFNFCLCIHAHVLDIRLSHEIIVAPLFVKNHLVVRLE